MPSEPSVVDLRAHRDRILRLGIITSILNRGIAALAPLLVVPIALRYLGVTDYGAWATALAFTAFVGFADLGIGTGLMTRLGALQDLPQGVTESRRLVASAYFMMTVIVAVALLSLWGSTFVVDWAGFLGVRESRLASGVNRIILITFAAVMLNMLASLVVRVQYGIGQQGRSNLWQSVGSAASLLAALAVSRFDPGHEWFVAASAVAPVAIATANSLTFFFCSSHGRRLRGGVSGTHLRTMKVLLRLGSRFLVVSLLMTASVAVDPWIVARTTSLSSVPSYVIPYRVFALIGTVSVMATMPLWPLHSRALAAGDIEWVRRITRRMTLSLTAVVAVLCVLAIVAGPLIVHLWLGGRIEVEYPLWIGLALWWCVQTSTGAAFMVQNGAEVLKPQILGYALLLVLALPLKWWASEDLGPWAIPWVGSVLYCLLIWPACYVGYRNTLKRGPFRGVLELNP